MENTPTPVVLESTDVNLPVKDDGEPFLHSVDFAGKTIFADTLGEVIDHILDGYATIDFTDEGDDQALFARADACTHFANIAQASVIEHTGLPDDLNDDEKMALTLDRSVPLELDGEWSMDVPLVLVATNYAPYTDVPAPEGNVVFLNPHTEVTFLVSGSQLGLWTFRTRSHSVLNQMPVNDEAEEGGGM